MSRTPTEWSVAGLPVSFDRRRFLTGLGAGAAGVVVAKLMPGQAQAGVAEDMAASGRLEDWTIDDMWGVYPRPAEPIGFARPPREPAPAAGLDPQLTP